MTDQVTPHYFTHKFLSIYIYSHIYLIFFSPNAKHLANIPFSPYSVGKIYYLFDTTEEAHVA